MNRTKIICTAGPSISSDEKLIALVQNGMSLIRINCSHGAIKDRLEHVQRIRRIEKKLKKPIGLMLDLQGPKFRVGLLPQPFILNNNEIWQLSEKIKPNAAERQIQMGFPHLPQYVKVGTHLYMDDGLIHGEVVKKDQSSVWIRIIHGGLLESRKGVNIPYHQGQIVVLGEKDKEDLIWGLQQEVDFFALSFVRSAQDMIDLKEFIRAQKPKYTPICIAKIEKPEAMENLDAIIEASDGILIARGDLGIELPPEKVPVAQKLMVERCRFFKKPVIVATQMLDSMRQNPIPTRAEVSDVASAIYQGADAALLTGETSSGKFPVETCKMMNQIITEVENHMIQKSFRKTPDDFGIRSSEQAFIFNLMQLADDLPAKAIVMLTREGTLTKIISKLHPHQPIYSLASNLTKYRQLNLYWGVYPIQMNQKLAEERIKKGLQILKKEKVVKAGDHLIFVYKDYKNSRNMNLKVVQV